MSMKPLVQVVSYIPGDLRKQIDQEIQKSKTRTSISSFIESVLREHLSKKKAAA